MAQWHHPGLVHSPENLPGVHGTAPECTIRERDGAFSAGWFRLP
jgi:hypothetical protein